MKKIFLYEPDAAIFEVIEMALDGRCQVRALPDPEAENFTTRVFTFYPDLIILDCYAYREKIKHWCKCIKATLPDTPLMAFSCDSDIGQKYRRLGFDLYLQKPFDIDELINITEFSTGPFLHTR